MNLKQIVSWVTKRVARQQLKQYDTRIEAIIMSFHLRGLSEMAFIVQYWWHDSQDSNKSTKLLILEEELKTYRLLVS